MNMKALTKDQAAKVNGLRELADHLERNPELAEHTTMPTFYVFVQSGAEFARLALQLGTSTKSADDTFYNVDRSFGPVKFQVTAKREIVCERVVTAIEEVEVFERDPELVEAALSDIPMVTTTKIIEKVEWVCPPSIGSLLAS